MPNITPHRETGIGCWSTGDIECLLAIGMTPEGDFVGDAMGEVVEPTTGNLTDAHRASIAEYLLDRPPVEISVR